MAAERHMERGLVQLQGLLQDHPDICTVETTVVTGMESIAKSECAEKLGAKAVVLRGRIMFDMPVDRVAEVFSLRSVDNVLVVVDMTHKFQWESDKEKDLQKLCDHVYKIHWDKALEVWKNVTKFEGIIYYNGAADDDAKADTVTETRIEGDSLSDEVAAKMKVPDDEVETESNVSESQEKADALKEEIDDLKKDADTEKTGNGSEVAQEESDANMRVEVQEDILVETDPAGKVQEDAEGEAKASNEVGECDIKSETNDAVQGENQVTEEKCGESSGSAANYPPGLLKFRATGYRSGQKHSFTSMDAARHFGGTVQDKFQWKVDMKHYDLEVVINIDDDRVYTCLSLTGESLHRRNITHFGPTTLRATICYNMLRLADIKPGDIVMDPMCGGGSIPIEGALGVPGAYYICGDFFEKAWKRTQDNVNWLNERQSSGMKLDICTWDACLLPIRNKSIDVVVTDLPFGKRMGSKVDNKRLYPKVLNELARVCRPATGRAVLLTQDKVTFSKAAQQFSFMWRTVRIYGVNVGGLRGAIFVLTRTANDLF